MSRLIPVLLFSSVLVASTAGEPRTTSDQGPAAATGSLATVQSLQYAFRRVAQMVMPVVVEIDVGGAGSGESNQPSSPFDLSPGSDNNDLSSTAGTGSGVIVSRRGKTFYALTDYHLVSGARNIEARLFDGRVFKAKLKGEDDRLDLALVDFDSDTDVPVAVLGDSDDLYVGDWVLAIGNPYGLEWSVTTGIVSALGFRAGNGSVAPADYIQTDAAINPGNSGGALANIYGQVVGINSWIATQTGGNIGLGFAIPSNVVKRVVSEILSKGKVSYGWLGVSVLTPQLIPGLVHDLGLEGINGTFVANVYAKSPADKGGIRPGDMITAFGGTAVTSAGDLLATVANSRVGSQSTVTVIRSGTRMLLTVMLAEENDQGANQTNSSLWPGFAPVHLSADMRPVLRVPPTVAGVVTGTIYPDSPAAKAGLRGTDVITEIDGHSVTDLRSFYILLNQLPGRTATLTVLRAGRRVRLDLSL